MAHDLKGFIEELKSLGELIDIKEELSTVHEIPGVMRYIDKYAGASVLFNRVAGYDIPIIGNILGKKRRLAIALGVPESEIIGKYLNSKKKPIKPVVVDTGPVKEVEILQDVNITKTMPVLTHHEKDAGPYFTCAVTMAKDPETGIRGMGIHRIQVKDKDTIGIFLASPPLSHFLTKAEEKRVPLEIAIVIGIDPITFFTSVIFAPFGIDKLEIAGGLAGRPVELVKCRTIDLEVPAHAEFVLEGYIIPGERQKEGPFGESTGYYLTYNNPVAKIKAITHRKNPIYHALMPFSSEESILLDFIWELDKMEGLQKSFPFVEKVHLTNMGLVAIVQIKKERENNGPDILKHLFSHPFIKLIIVVDDDIDPYDLREVEWAVATRVQPDQDVLIQSNLPGLMIDPSTPGGEVSPEFFSTLVPKTSKMGIDATKPLWDYERYEKIDVPEKVKSKIKPIIEKYLGTQTPQN